MRMYGAAVAVLCACSLLPGVAQVAPGDGALLQGSWEWDPAVPPPEAIPQVLVERVVVKGDTLTFHYRLGDQRSTHVTRFTLDEKGSPKRIDFTPVGGANAGRTYFGLYDVKDGKLRLCYRGPGSTRPKDFGDKQEPNSSAATAFIDLVLSPAK